MKASCLATSVLPTPGGAREQKRADWLVASVPRPARDILMADDSASMARVLPEHHRLAGRDPASAACCGRPRSRSCGGMRAMRETISSISPLPMGGFFCFDFGRMRWAAPASSITSMALSGRCRSVDEARRQFGRAVERRRRVLDAVVLLEARLQATRGSCTVWSTEGSTTSIFWKRRDRAASFSKMPRYSVNVVAPTHLQRPPTTAPA